MTGFLDHPQLGRVIVTTRTGMKNARAMWKNGVVHISVPAGAPADKVMGILDFFAPKMLAARPALPDFSPGTRMEFPGLAIEFRRAMRDPNHVSACPSLPLTIIEIGSEIHLDSPEGIAAVKRIMRRVAARFAEELLLPRARELAAEAGKEPAGWRISRGAKIMGTCHADRTISISSNVVFLPQELRDYIVWHELAHLSHMNHSPEFHAECNRLCHGREREFIAALKAYRLPI